MIETIKDRSPRWVKDVANITTRQYGLRTSKHRPGPDFLVIGTKRGGTTSLFNYLLMHPGVLGMFPQSRGLKSSDFFFSGNYGRGDSWYRSHFHTHSYRARIARKIGYQPVSGEASPYYAWDPRIAERAFKTSPNVKAIMLVRNPVDRAWSHFLERTENGVEPLDFVSALHAEATRLEGELDRMMSDATYHSTSYDWYAYRERGDYLPQIERWVSTFGADRLLVVRSEDMYENVQTVFDRVCDFLSLPYFELPKKERFNASRKGEAAPTTAVAELSDYFAPKVRQLESYLGYSLDWSLDQLSS